MLPRKNNKKGDTKLNGLNLICVFVLRSCTYSFCQL
jgi:hypothetical protein